MIVAVKDCSKETLNHIEAKYLLRGASGSAVRIPADKRLLRYIWRKIITWGCAHIVIEEGYIDRDFSEDHEAFYAGSHVNLGKSTTRLHFFQEMEHGLCDLPFSEHRTESNIQNHGTLNSKYIGFVVIRPLLARRIGRTVIFPPSEEIEQERLTLDPYGSSKNYCTASTCSNVNIDGIRLTVKGTPFVQQDKQVAVCSSAAIWMASRLMHLRYNFPRHSLSKITRNANRYLRINRSFPAVAGLNEDQIISAMIELGYTPLCYNKKTFLPKEKWDPKEIIYKYIESGLPVILIIRLDHACVVVGHDWDETRSIQATGKLCSTSNFISSFIVHDDEHGPYVRLPLVQSSTPGSLKFSRGQYFDPNEEQANEYASYNIDHITNIIIPTFRKVYLEGQQVQILLESIFQKENSIFLGPYLTLLAVAIEQLGKSTKTFTRSAVDFLGNDLYEVFRTLILDNYKDSIKNFSDATVEHMEGFVKQLSSDENVLFFRTRFCMSVDLKHDYLNRKIGADWVLRDAISKLKMPRYVWLTEIYTNDGIHGSEKLVSGEILVDATGIEHDDSILWFHLPGVIIQPHPDIDANEAAKFTFLEKDSSYPIFLGSRYTR